MMLSLFVGNILLIGIVSSTPLYTQATMQRILLKDLQQFQLNRNVHPATAEFRYTFNYVMANHILPTYYRSRDEHLPKILNKLGIPPSRVVQYLLMESWHCQPLEQREDRPRSRSLSVISYEGQYDHIRLTQGRFPSETVVDGNIIEVIANEMTMIRQDLLLDEILFTNILVSEDDEELVYHLRVVGMYEVADETDLYWTSNPNMFRNHAMVHDQLIYNHFINGGEILNRFNISSVWIMLLDYNKMSAVDVPRYQAADAELKEEFNKSEHIWNYKENFIKTLEGYSLRTDKLTVTLWVLQVPIYVLLAFYIFMVSRQILMLEQNDISVLKSRGASRGQIFSIYLIQSIITGFVSLAAGIPLGVTVCRLLGASNGFLEMVSRSALQVDLNREAFLYSGIAAVASILMMLVPVVRFSRVTIVDYKRNKSGKPKKELWQRFYLDVLCFGAACYGLYNFNSQRDTMARVITDVQAVDPLLLVSSSLFIIGMGLLCLRVFPYLVKLVFIVGRRFWSPSMYASLLKVIRSAGEEQFIMIFLVFTLAVGIFNAKAARTINLNNDHKILYQSGADLVFAERWRDNKPPPDMGGPGGGGPPAPSAPSQLVYFEPDFGRFTGFDEVDSITQVLVRKVDMRKTGSQISGVTMMAVDTKTFGETLWYRDDLLPVHINHFLNILAKQPNGVLLSRNFQTRLNYQVGDRISYSDTEGNNMYGFVYGFVDHWPAYSDMRTEINRAGERVQVDEYLLITNLGYLQTHWGMLPYEVWMKTNTPSNRFFREFLAERSDIRMIRYRDAKERVVDSKSDPILQGTNGVLTVGFIVTLLVCFTGFLIYWILSIKSRVLQFGIFRAMGMTMRNIVGLLINEQVFITLMAVAIGATVGEVSSRLFVPLIQISFTASEQVIPLMIITEGRDYMNLFATIGAMIAICLVILGFIISRIKIAQALKLGED